MSLVVLVAGPSSSKFVEGMGQEMRVGFGQADRSVIDPGTRPGQETF